MIVKSLCLIALAALLSGCVSSSVKLPDDVDPSSCRYALVDINGDQQQELLLLRNGIEWCGSGGCTLQLYRWQDSRFQQVSRTTLVREPIYLSPQPSAQPQNFDLLVDTKGIGQVRLSYSENGYPLNPSLQKPETATQGDRQLEFNACENLR